MYTNYKVVYRFKKEKKELNEVVMAKSAKEASNEVEKKHDYNIVIIDAFENLPSWGDRIWGKLFKWIFKKR